MIGDPAPFITMELDFPGVLEEINVYGDITLDAVTAIRGAEVYQGNQTTWHTLWEGSMSGGDVAFPGIVTNVDRSTTQVFQELCPTAVTTRYLRLEFLPVTTDKTFLMTHIQYTAINALVPPELVRSPDGLLDYVSPPLIPRRAALVFCLPKWHPSLWLRIRHIVLRCCATNNRCRIWPWGVAGA